MAIYCRTVECIGAIKAATMVGRWMLYAAAVGLAAPTQLMAQVTPVGPATIVPIVAPQTTVPPQAVTPLIQKSIDLSQNEMLRVFGRLEFTSGFGTTQQGDQNLNYSGAWLECFDPSMNPIGGAQVIGENYLGLTQAAGPGYPTTGHQVMYLSTLITASTPGSYSCRMLASADKGGTVVGRANQADNTTWLGLSAPIAPRAPNGVSDALSYGGFSGCFWQGPYTAPDKCLYLGPSPGSRAAPYVDVFSSANMLPPSWPGFWSPVPGAAFVDVTAVVKVSLCGKITQCAAQFRTDSSAPVVIDTYLELDQLNADGKAFHKTVSPPQLIRIDNLLHHDMIFHRLTTVPVYPSSNPPRFQVIFFITWLSGNTAIVDGAQAVAFTTYRGQTQFVPNVVGMEQAAARKAISAAGYSVGLISPPESLAGDKVVSQQPSSEVIELPGSPVNLVFGGGHGPVTTEHHGQ